MALTGVPSNTLLSYRLHHSNQRFCGNKQAFVSHISYTSYRYRIRTRGKPPMLRVPLHFFYSTLFCIPSPLILSLPPRQGWVLTCFRAGR